MPGAMAAAARDRLVSLSAERSQAIEDIQRGLLVLKFYKGDVDGKAGNGTARAVKDFATSRNRTFPTLSTAAPRDLRAFAEIVSKAAGTLPSSRTPIVATATTPVKPASAEDADRDRIAKAQAAIQAASKAATETAATQAAVSSGSDSGAVSELQKMADQNAWADAEKVGTLAAYQNYLVAHPSGAQTAAAKAAVTRLSRPAPYSLELVPAEVKAAADAARKAQASANSRAAQARETAAAADSAPGAREIVAADGDKYQTQISGGAPNGLGVRLSGGAGNAGDRYRGELRNGQTAGLGVYEYANNPGNSSSGALRYEGEHSSDAASGYGVTYWKNGDSFAGLGNGPNGLGRGVLTFSNGQRYEGEMRNGTRNGYGVVWSADGSILMAGRWVNGELVEPAAKPDGQ
jgi:peptidoglycan hydrolase-like protein with peptidoglycan-binding domain